MRNFGINLLGTVQSVIGKQTYTVARWLDRTSNATGDQVNVYSAVQQRSGSVQPVERSAYKDFGLDFSAVYIQIWDTDIITSLDRSGNGDVIQFDGWEYFAQRGTDWQTQGGWGSVFAIRNEGKNVLP